MREDFTHRILLDQLTIADYRDAIADTFDDIHLVGNQQNSQPQATVDIFQQFQNGARGCRVQGAGGFVTAAPSGCLPAREQ